MPELTVRQTTVSTDLIADTPDFAPPRALFESTESSSCSDKPERTGVLVVRIAADADQRPRAIVRLTGRDGLSTSHTVRAPANRSIAVAAGHLIEIDYRGGAGCHCRADWLEL